MTLENARQGPPADGRAKIRGCGSGLVRPYSDCLVRRALRYQPGRKQRAGFGQGAEGYGKRFGAYAADGTIENFFVGAILPSVLHQDPRFFQSGHGSFFDRTGYAVSRIFVTRTDSGHSQFNFSEIFGSRHRVGISTYSYHPGRTLLLYRPRPHLYRQRPHLKNTASVWGSQVGYDTITLVIKEFWPDIRRKLKKQPH